MHRKRNGRHLVTGAARPHRAGADRAAHGARACRATTTGVGPAVAECKRLVDDLFLTVRNLALGLRPSMLDDFGLRAALEWHVRDFMSRYAITVDLTTDGDLEALPEKHRTCVYRVVQEAMTNCVRHARARTFA